MTSPHVICLGEVLFDYLADQSGREYAEVTSWTPYPGGAPANVACGLAKLGTSSAFIGCVGSDEAGDTLISVLRSDGVEVSGVQRHSTAPTRLVYVTRSEEGERTFAGFGDLDTTRFADAFLNQDQLPVPLFEAADFLVLGTLELAYPQTRAAIETALQLCEQNFVKILLDVNWRPMFWPDPAQAEAPIRALMQRVDFLKLSDEEAQWLFGTMDPGVIAHRLGQVEGVFVTAGAQGCAYCLGGNEGKVPALSVKAVDTTGAGDAFVAGLLHQLNQTAVSNLNDPQRAQAIVRYANAVGALTTTAPGAIAAQPTAAAVDVLLRQVVSY
ncbi:carbohydrate kinase [Leptolyngbya sp. FACHB-261]|uniref:carbohydrate kinase family protein n=1 Tax=Leptolyngbya sp. FACHB-261 TaxID=2692806 RepID=UPI0016896756|nr:carbohydrate kinase [Leptolyngbya sp. FACHB-261]MBD2104925.1 carbohydrate kinase [Leptolyngbya sp. FACHB-261]